MKRILLSVTATVLGLIALLSFKTRQPITAPPGGLPSASVSSPSTRQSAPPQPPRTRHGTSAVQKFLGSAIQTRYGIVQVRVTVNAHRLTAVSFAQLTAFDQHSQDINAQAGPVLLRETLDAQGAHIDSVSGASYTSDGYVRSLQSALDQAGVR